MRWVRSGCGAWCLLNVERYGVEEDGDEDEDVDDDDEKKMQTLFSLLFAFVCEVVGRRVCAEGRE